MTLSKLSVFLNPLLGTLSAPASAAYANLTGSTSDLRSDLLLLVNMAYLMYQGLLDNWFWQVRYKQAGNVHVNRAWAYDHYDLAGTNIYIPLDYGNESWSLRPR